jgi:hypothetical protein
VEDYVSGRDDVEPTLRNFQEMISKYQFMEASLQKRVVGLKEKVPDIQKTLDAVRFLKTRKVRHAGGGCRDKLPADQDIGRRRMKPSPLRRRLSSTIRCMPRPGYHRLKRFSFG